MWHVVPKTTRYVWCSVQLPGMKSLIAARPQGYTPVCYVQTHSSRANNCVQRLGLVMDAENHHSTYRSHIKKLYRAMAVGILPVKSGGITELNRWNESVCVCVFPGRNFFVSKGGIVTPKLD